MKISAKINTMQNTNILLNELKECLRSDFRQYITDTATDQWRNRLQACVCANGGHFDFWTPFANKLLQTIGIFHGSSGLYPSCQLFTVL